MIELTTLDVHKPALKLRSLRSLVTAVPPRNIASERAVRTLRSREVVRVGSGDMVCEFADVVNDRYSLVGIDNSGRPVRVRTSQQYLAPKKDGSVTPDAGYVEINTFSPSDSEGRYYLDWLKQGGFIRNG